MTTMKSFMISMGLAALVNAQADSTGYFPGEPSCALPCLSSAITAAGCQLSDIACQCGPTQTAIAGKVAGCLLTSCDSKNLSQAMSAGLAVCSSFHAGELSFTNPGGPIQTPTPVPGSSSSSSTSVTVTTSATETSSIIMTLPPIVNSTYTSASETGGTSSESSSGTDSGTDSDVPSTTPTTTHTDTIRVSSSILTGTVTSELTSSPSGAAATPAMLGAGVLAGIMGAVALL
ncbi:hypothetical protein F5Y17DRAFT_458935 [Xylariaceae sp. FL0594]|nr:hypothetical protein F5Y17DRAFT_458935 [Xylariaceae sp. FL0594]